MEPGSQDCVDDLVDIAARLVEELGAADAAAADAAAGCRGRRRFVQRSRQLTEHMRAAKERKRQERLRRDLEAFNEAKATHNAELVRWREQRGWFGRKRKLTHRPAAAQPAQPQHWEKYWNSPGA